MLCLRSLASTFPFLEIKEGQLRTRQSPKVNLDGYFVVLRVVDSQCINGQGKIRLIEIK